MLPLIFRISQIFFEIFYLILNVGRCNKYPYIDIYSKDNKDNDCIKIFEKNNNIKLLKKVLIFNFNNIIKIKKNIILSLKQELKNMKNKFNIFSKLFYGFILPIFLISLIYSFLFIINSLE